MPPKQQPLPSNLSLEAQRQLVFQPETNPTGHLPFEDAETYQFEPEATHSSRVNAWWLAEASWLAYWHSVEDVRRIYREQANLPSCELIAAGGTECYLAWRNEFAIVAFRGTQPGDWADIFDDVRYAAIPWDAGYVHQGFAHALDVVRAELEKAIGNLPSGCRVWFTGHSLGAAIATLAAYRYRHVAAGVYTFGSPLVGNGAFARTFGGVFEDRSTRYVNDHDVVTRVPPEPFALPHGLFTHVDHLRWIDEKGHIGTTSPSPAHFVRDVFGRANVLLDLTELHLANARLNLPDALSDHTPLYYVLHCWNDFAAHGSD